MALEITSGSRRAHKTKQKTHYYKITKALIKNQMSNPQLFIFVERGLGGREGTCAGKLQIHEKIKIKKKKVF